LATGQTGLRYRGRDDLMVAELAPQTTVAAVLTRSQTAAAPVLWCRQVAAGGQARAIVVNAGNANAFTGAAGDHLVAETTAAASRLFGCKATEVAVASTGVIGEPLPADALAVHLPTAVAALSEQGWSAAARAIMTTDTFPKAATATAVIDGRTVTLNGFAKGSGMIAPNMATMLVFLFTDAAVAAPVLQQLLSAANEETFNCITVDGDTSTSDSVLLCATGTAGHPLIVDAGDPRAAVLATALRTVMRDLAHQVVRDGEGATKFVTLHVSGAMSDAEAREVALTIANSPLVKTAIAGEDANWGRIVAAAGRARARVDAARLAIAIGGVAITADGQRVAGYDEAPVARHMKGQEIDIAVDLGLGQGQATVWTCDLTHGYIDINGSYRS